jgi:hypothetical protein
MRSCYHDFLYALAGPLAACWNCKVEAAEPLGVIGKAA